MSDTVSHNQHDLTPEDECLLDLLVDGELDERRRRQLLLSFEEQPSGWRRCALAFLEAQSWGGSFKAMLKEQPAVPAGSEVTPAANASPMGDSSRPQLAVVSSSGESVAGGSVPAGPRTAKRPWQVRPLSGLAMAASMLVAFTLGIALRNSYAPSEAERPQGGSTAGMGVQPFQFAPTMRNMPDAADEKVRLVVDGTDGQQAMDVSLIDDPSLVDSYPFRNDSSIPAEILHELEKMGHRVEHQRRLAPVLLPDGRRLYLPVEDVKIVPVRRQMY